MPKALWFKPLVRGSYREALGTEIPMPRTSIGARRRTVSSPSAAEGMRNPVAE